ncbi:TPA: ribosomal-protein-alanine N-acetyltransferase [Candidatus Bathyarchaeota archaeon]|nr:ribosomal-protein-alanine N-acetyltransferase [Candidatus Bathyarchaeota archaeon]
MRQKHLIRKKGSDLDPSYILRKFEPKDLYQVMSINQRCLPENYSESFFISLHKNFPETFIVSEKDGTVIGYIMCRIESGLSSIGFTPFSLSKKGHIISIAVLPEHQRKGLGRALIEKALETMTKFYNAKSCYLEVRISNEPAIRLYKKVGFEVQRTIKGYYADGENAYIMSRKIKS